MSFDLYIAPPSGFLDWGDDRWEEFFRQSPEGEQLGRSWYIGSVLEAISHNLEGDMFGSKYPLLMRFDTAERVGWYKDEVGPLLRELEEIKRGLGLLPIGRATLNYDKDEEVERRISDFKKSYPNRPLENLYDINFHFFNVFEKLGQKALNAGKGLAVFY